MPSATPSWATRCSAWTSTCRRSKKLTRGEVPFHEPGLDEMLQAQSRPPAGCDSPPTTRRRPTSVTSISSVSAPRSARRHGADLRYVESGRREPRPHLTRKALIVGKSTVPVGTAEWVEQLVAKHARRAGVEVAWSPEFLQEGFAVDDVMRPNRIVSASKSDWADRMLHAAHKGVFDLASTEDRDVPVVAPTSPPPSWSRSRPTRSSPPRSPSSTRWPRSARWPVVT